jgi:hypothetical protein
MQTFLPEAKASRPAKLQLGLILAVILITVFEGAVRKWIMPNATNVLLLARDLAALLVVARVAYSGGFRKMPFATECLIVWSLAVAMWGAWQIIVLQGPVVLFFIGLRFWLLYLWLALAMGCSLTEGETRIVVKVMIAVALLMMPLVALQHSLPPSSVLNLQPDTEEDKIFRLSGDIVRVSGTFTFVMGYACFVAAVTPFALGHVWKGRPFYESAWLKALVFAAICVETLFSGSRASITFFGFLLAAQLLIDVVCARSARDAVSSLLKVALVVVALFVMVYLFSDAVTATQDRFVSASESESFTDRVAAMVFGEPQMRDAITFLGSGLGAGTNAGAVLLTGEQGFELAETEQARVILEMGAMGFAWVLIKCVLIAWGMRKSLGKLRSGLETLPLLVWITIAYGLLSWPISGQLSANAFGYILLGLGFACLEPAAGSPLPAFGYMKRGAK